MKKTRVWIVHNILTPYMIPIFNELAKRQSMDVVVFSMAESESNRHWILNRDIMFDHTLLNGVHLTLGRKDTHTLHLNPGIMLRILRGKPDVVVSSGYSSITNILTLVASKIARIPLVLWSGSTENEENMVRKLARPFLRWFVGHSDGFIAYGTAAREHLRHLGAADDRITIAFNTVEIEHFVKRTTASDALYRRDLIRSEMGMNDTFVVLNVGQLIERKGLGTLVKAVEALQHDIDIGLVLVGSGREKDALQKQASSLRKVAFVGRVDYDRLPDYYGAADLFVLPSFEEVWGLVVNEAMACGLPVISSTSAGCTTDLVREGINGFKFEPGNMDMLESKMRILASNPEMRASFGRTSRRIIEEGFSVRRSADAVLNAIQRAETMGRESITRTAIRDC